MSVLAVFFITLGVGFFFFLVGVFGAFHLGKLSVSPPFTVPLYDLRTRELRHIFPKTLRKAEQSFSDEPENLVIESKRVGISRPEIKVRGEILFFPSNEAPVLAVTPGGDARKVLRINAASSEAENTRLRLELAEISSENARLKNNSQYHIDEQVKARIKDLGELTISNIMRNKSRSGGNNYGR